MPPYSHSLAISTRRRFVSWVRAAAEEACYLFARSSRTSATWPPATPVALFHLRGSPCSIPRYPRPGVSDTGGRCRLALTDPITGENSYRMGND
jgi:hypothetical protein